MDLELINKFRANYKSNQENSNIENNIRKNGIKKACLNNSIVKKFNYNFNVEIPETKIYNQYNSSECYIYATLRMIKSILYKKEKNLLNLDLSANYLEFYDKLEKVNVLYDKLIELEEITVDIINNQVNRLVGNYGTFHFCRNLINKYGLVLEKDMPDVNENYNTNLVIELLRAKIKIDAISLMNCPKKSRENLKIKLLEEAYDFLSKTMGNPPTEFIYNGKSYTPVSFKNELLENELDNYVTITPFAKNIFYESYAFTPSIYISSNESIIEMKASAIKKCIIKQLQDGIGVWFSCEESTTLDFENGIIDNELYDYSKYLNIKKINTAQKLLFGIIGYDHAMCITGALLTKNDIIQFKVDDSFGIYGKYNGHLIMPSNFLENGIITVVIHKKFITKENKNEKNNT